MHGDATTTTTSASVYSASLEPTRGHPRLETYAGVDSRPLIERAWAQASGLGFIGKNAMAILPGQSSYFFLAAILVNVELEPDAPLGEHCGSCRRCLSDVLRARSRPRRTRCDDDAFPT